MKITQLFSRFPIKSLIFQVKTFNKMNVTFFLFCIPEKRMGDIIKKKILYFYKIKCSYGLANEKMLNKYFKITRRFCFNRCFKGSLSHG